MKIYRHLALSALSLSFAFTANADTIKLSDGRTFEGKVSLETEDSYTLLVEVKPGIRDEIVVKKHQVRSIRKADPSSKPFEKIKKLLPTADLLTADDYQKIIDSSIASFLKKYPTSTHLEEVEKIKATLLAEKEKVAKNELKLDGKWLTAETIAANKVEVDAAVKAAHVMKLARARSFGPALTALKEMEKGYTNTKPYKEAAKFCLSFLPVYEAQAEKIVREAKSVKKKRDLSFDRLSSEESSRLKRLLEQEEKTYQAQLKKAKKLKSPWLPLNKFHPKAAASVLKSIELNVDKLTKQTTTTTGDAGEAYRNTLMLLQKEQLPEAKLALKDLSKLHIPKEDFDKLTSSYNKLELKAKELKKQQRKDASMAKRKARAEAQAKRKAARAKKAPKVEEPTKEEKTESKTPATAE